jgi:hypothetical protein
MAQPQWTTFRVDHLCQLNENWHLDKTTFYNGNLRHATKQQMSDFLTNLHFNPMALGHITNNVSNNTSAKIDIKMDDQEDILDFLQQHPSRFTRQQHLHVRLTPRYAAYLSSFDQQTLDSYADS